MSNFDNVAKTWDKEGRTLKRVRFVSEQIKNLCTKNGSALDFGAGTGLLGMELGELFTSVDFYDTSKMMVEVIKEKIDGENKFKVVDKIKDRYETIFNSMVLHHIENHNEIIKTFYKALNNGGELFIHDLEPEDGSFHTDLDYEGHFGIDKDKLKNIMTASGFSCVTFYESFMIEKNERIYPTFLIKAVK